MRLNGAESREGASAGYHGNKNDVGFTALERHVTATDLVLNDFFFAEMGNQKLEDIVGLLVTE
jgi:hypothetical protein